MKYRTNKAIFNTETGILLCPRDRLSMSLGCSETHFKADLYKTRSGDFFLCGSGGLMSVFRGHKEDKIIPLALDEAQGIAKEFMQKEAYRAEFE